MHTLNLREIRKQFKRDPEAGAIAWDKEKEKLAQSLKAQSKDKLVILLCEQALQLQDYKEQIHLQEQIISAQNHRLQQVGFIQRRCIVTNLYSFNL